MTLARLDPDLFARKGEAAPTPFAGCETQAAAFAGRRRLGLAVPQVPGAGGAAPPRQTAADGGLRRRRREWRRRLTFRLEPALHARLAAAAAQAGLSRQRYLERALAASLRRTDTGGAS